ncbi:hypothetical protein Syun_004125 [Stephania yunnanensis]|uniref:Uncharacterized protein n=1 Tax=Stephania yunnanensis TaxID=152371 RepID=A0AAP0Q0W5_9MAGN
MKHEKFETEKFCIIIYRDIRRATSLSIEWLDIGFGRETLYSTIALYLQVHDFSTSLMPHF